MNNIVWEADQIITPNDLAGLLVGYAYQYKKKTWWTPRDKFKFLVAVVVIDSLIQWIKAGKPLHFSPKLLGEKK